MTDHAGRFVVSHADEGAAELQDPESGQVFALVENPGIEKGEVIEATLEPAEEMGVAFRVADLADRWTVEMGRSPEAPTGQAESAGLDQSVGELTRIERAGEGELHVITVPADGVDEAVDDVLDDEAGLLARAARLGVGRVEVRAAEVSGDDATVGVLSVRYLP